VTEPAQDVVTVNTRLTEAAQSGEAVELILVVRGKVRPTRGADRWRLHVGGRRVISFHADSVLAATPVARAKRRP
jgi:hypothetical protein